MSDQERCTQEAVCKHGQIRRQCEACEGKVRINQLRSLYWETAAERDSVDKQLTEVREENSKLRRAVGELLVAVAKAGAPLEALLWAHKNEDGWDSYLSGAVQDGIDNGVTAVREALARYREYADE